MSIADLKPRKFDLSNPQEICRLLLESAGYLHTCKRDHHGTDFQGRQFAMDALRQLAETYALPSPQNQTAKD